MNASPESKTGGRRRAVRPRDAASLVLLRRDGDQAEVLLGQRSSGHAFMPNRFVFPGGAVDRRDARVSPATPLPGPVMDHLLRGCPASRARALAIAAVRETWEETGLIIGAPAPAPRGWHGFADAGLGPALDGLDFFCRAITPPSQPIRFDARFFVVDASRAQGELAGSGELKHLQWVSLDAAREMPIPRITANVLEELRRHMAEDTPPRRIPLFRTLYGRRDRHEH